MATTQVEGMDTILSAENALIQWLKANSLGDKKLIQGLTEEGVEDVDDLLMFDETQLKARLIQIGIKIGVISKLMKALNKQRKQDQSPNDHDQSKTTAPIIMLDKDEKDAIQKLQSELRKTQKKLESLPPQTKQISSAKEFIKKEISTVSQEWIKLIKHHEKSLHEWIDSIEQQEIDKQKAIKEKLNDELHLLQKTKSKCQHLMTFASINDIWAQKDTDVNEDDTKDNIVSLVNSAVSQLDVTLVIPTNNVFGKLKFEPYDADKTQKLLSQNIGKLISTPKLVVNAREDKLEFVVQDQLNAYNARELYVKVSYVEENNNDIDEKEQMNVIKLPMIENKYVMSVEDLDQKFGEHEDYAAYVVDVLGNVKRKWDDVIFHIDRKPPPNIDIAASDYHTYYGDKPDIKNGFACKQKDVSGFKYKVNIPKQGDYVVWVYTGTQQASNKSYGSWDDFDGQSVKTHVWYKQTTSTYQGNEWIKSSTHHLSKGQHTWMFGSRKDENFFTVPWSRFIITADLNFKP